MAEATPAAQQPLADAVVRMRVVQREVHHVVEQVAGEEAGARSPRVGCAENDVEQSEEACCERERERRRQHETLWIVRMVVMHAVDHPVQARADSVRRLEVEDRTMSPVLAERPERVAADQLHDDLPVRLTVERDSGEDEDGRQEDHGRDRRVHAGQPVERRRLEDRRRCL